MLHLFLCFKSLYKIVTGHKTSQKSTSRVLKRELSKLVCIRFTTDLQIDKNTKICSLKLTNTHFKVHQCTHTHKLFVNNSPPSRWLAAVPPADSCLKTKDFRLFCCEPETYTALHTKTHFGARSNKFMVPKSNWSVLFTSSACKYMCIKSNLPPLR